MSPEGTPRRTRRVVFLVAASWALGFVGILPAGIHTALDAAWAWALASSLLTAPVLLVSAILMRYVYELYLRADTADHRFAIERSVPLGLALTTITFVALLRFSHPGSLRPFLVQPYFYLLALPVGVSAYAMRRLLERGRVGSVTVPLLWFALVSPVAWVWVPAWRSAAALGELAAVTGWFFRSVQYGRPLWCDIRARQGAFRPTTAQVAAFFYDAATRQIPVPDTASTE